MYWVHPINQWCHEYEEFNTLYENLRNHPERFYTYYQMNTEQFDYILSQIEHLIYKPRTNFQATICPEEQLAICIRYPVINLYLKIDNIVMVLSSFTMNVSNQLNVFRLYCHPFCVNGAQLGVLNHLMRYSSATSCRHNNVFIFQWRSVLNSWVILQHNLKWLILGQLETMLIYLPLNDAMES